MKTIAIYNMKGGVGKTTVAVNLAYLASTDGLKTLLCDLDPQGAASFYMRVQSPKKFKAKHLIKGNDKMLEAIKATNYEELDILPSAFSFRKLATQLHDKKRETLRIKESLDLVRPEYDLIVIDAPAGLDLETENIFSAADIVLIPMIPSTLSVNTYETITRFFRKRDLDTSKLWQFFSLVDKRKKLHTQTIESLRQRQSNVLFTSVPYSSTIEKMGVTREPVPMRSRKSKAALSFINLWEELKVKLPIEVPESAEKNEEPVHYIY